MTIGELLQMYLQHHLVGKPSAAYYGRLIRQVFPSIRDCPVESIDKTAMLEWWGTLRDRPSHANKAIGVLRASIRWALGLGLLTCEDPTVGIKKRPDKTRSQTVSPEEWSRLLPYLEDLPLKRRIYYWAVYLLGSRPGEVRGMRPEQLHLEQAQPTWIKPMTKNGKPHVVPLPEQLVPLLRLLRAANPPEARWMFWGERPDKVWGRQASQKLWQNIRAKAGLHHLWMNDLRRSTASDLLNQGENLGVVQAALNHRSLSQTAKYAYLAVKPLSTALQRRADTVCAQLPA